MIIKPSRAIAKSCIFYKIYMQANLLMIMILHVCKTSIAQKINDCERNSFYILPTIDECTDAVHNLKNNKSPGLDGFPGEFYKSLWKIIGPLFYDMLLCIFEKHELPFSQRLSLITLLFKRGDENNIKATDR